MFDDFNVDIFCLQTCINLWVNSSLILMTNPLRIKSHVNECEINVYGHILGISRIWSHYQCLHNK